MTRPTLDKLIVSLVITVMLLLGPLTAGAQAGGPGPIRDLRQEKISPELRRVLASNATGPVPIIVQMRPGAADALRAKGGNPERETKRKIENHGGKDTKGLGIIGGASGKISPNRLATLSLDPDVLHISYDAKLRPAGSIYGGDMVDFTKALSADAVWAQGIRGAGVTVAVIDSGVKPLAKGVESSRVVGSVDLVTGSGSRQDPGGHGTHVASIIAGKHPTYFGVAPESNIVSVRVFDDTGNTRMSTVIRGIQWAIQNRKTYGIRVINLSLGAPATTSYRLDPLAAAVEMAWHSGLVVVASAGNQGPNPGTISTPGYDPFAITVGAADMRSTVDRSNDIVASFSSVGPTIDGLTKPDVLAPGRRMVSSRVKGSYLDSLYPDRVVEDEFFRLSGTSQAAGAISGVVALMLNAKPGLTPDQVKRILMSSASPMAGYNANTVGAGYVDAEQAVRYGPVGGRQSARPADSFAASVFPLIKGKSTLAWKSLSFNGGVDSRGIPWSNVTWDNVTWDNVTWDNLAWDNLAWDNVAWDNTAWDNTAWDNTAWDNTAWDAAGSFD